MGVEHYCDLCNKDLMPEDMESGHTKLKIRMSSNVLDLLDCIVCNFCRDELIARKDKMLRLMSIMAVGGCDGKPSFDA